MQKMDGRTESQTDTELLHPNLIFCTLNKVICKVSAQYVKARRRKVQKTVYFQYSGFQKGHNSHKNQPKLRHPILICSTVKQSHMQNFSLICQSV